MAREALELLHDEAGGRVVLLGHLRARGVARIGDRQAVANALGRALRLGSLLLWASMLHTAFVLAAPWRHHRPASARAPVGWA